MLVKVDQGLQDLIEEALGLFTRQGLVAMVLHIFFQVELTVLEDEEELVLRVDNLLQLDYVRVPQPLQKADFADGRRRYTIIFFLQSDLFQSHDLASLQVAALIYDTIRAFSKLLLALVTVQL